MVSHPSICYLECWRQVSDSEMETSSLRIPPVWKHDERITPLWVNWGPPSFALSVSWALYLPPCLPSPSLTHVSFLCLSHRLVVSHVRDVLLTASCVCWAAFTRPPPLPHPSTPLHLWPPQPHLPTQILVHTILTPLALLALSTSDVKRLSMQLINRYNLLWAQGQDL